MLQLIKISCQKIIKIILRIFIQQVQQQVNKLKNWTTVILMWIPFTIALIATKKNI